MFGMIDEVGTRVRLKMRRHCADCSKTLWGRGPKKCFDCREVETAQRLAGKRPCIECGVEPRVKGIAAKYCKGCSRERHLERMRIHCRNWKLKNRERVRAEHKAYLAANRAKQNAYNLAYYYRQKAKRQALAILRPERDGG